MALNKRLFDAVQEGDINELERSAKEGGDLKVLGKNNRTLLHFGCLSGREDVVKYLISKGLPLETKDEWNCTPLLLAVRCGYVGIARLLLDVGADLEAKSIWGTSALHLAVYQGNEKMVRFLLECGAKVNVRDNDYWTPMSTANCKQDKALMALLRSYHGVS